MQSPYLPLFPQRKLVKYLGLASRLPESGMSAFACFGVTKFGFRRGELGAVVFETPTSTQNLSS